MEKHQKYLRTNLKKEAGLVGRWATGSEKKNTKKREGWVFREVGHMVVLVRKMTFSSLQNICH